MKECTSHLCPWRVFLRQITHPCVTLSSLHIIALWQYFFSDDGWNFRESHQTRINGTAPPKGGEKKLAKLWEALSPAHCYMQLRAMQWSVAWITVSLFASKSNNSSIPLCKDVLSVATGQMLLSLGCFLAVWSWWRLPRTEAGRLLAAADFCLPTSLPGDACVHPQDRRPPAGRCPIIVVNEGHHRHLCWIGNAKKHEQLLSALMINAGIRARH